MKICIWTGRAYEQWGPRSIDKGGIGGSETAAINMAFELARLGHEVHMFGDHGTNEEGWWYDHRPASPGAGIASRHVHYVHYQKAIDDPKMLACDVFVSSRDKTILRVGIQAPVKVLWAHDIHVGDDWEHEVDVFERVYCLSEWHRSYFLERYPHLDPAKCKLTRNAIDPTRFAPDMSWKALRKSKRPRFVWSSSLDRGVDVLLDAWPEIKRMRPDADLDIYYGTAGMRALNAEAKNNVGLKVIDYLEQRARSMTSDGVRYHGRVGQQVLAEAHMSALCWAYPTAFLETSCITALEAQAAGAYPVTSRQGALSETVRDGTLLIGRNKSSSYRDAFLNAVEKALNFGDEIESACIGNRSWALERTWTKVAAEWHADFTALLAPKAAP